jgi:hypothetical protein
MGLNLIFYGECPQAQYGGPEGTENARQMTERWRAEFGGFLGLRPQDMLLEGITERDIIPYTLPNDIRGLSAYWLGQFYPWDSRRNADIAIANGMIAKKPSFANYWDAENLDNAQTGLHDFFMFRKFGFGRGCAQISVDIRNGLITREDALEWVKEHDGHFPYEYAGVCIEEIMDRIEITWPELVKAIDEFSNYEIHSKWLSPFG